MPSTLSQSPSRRWLRRGLVIFAFSFLALACAHVWHYRPLLRSTAWKAEVTHTSLGRIEAPVYQMLFRPHHLFIEVPASHRDGYGWFALDTRRQAIAVGASPHKGLYLVQNHDMSLGVNLTSRKIGDSWSIHWTAAGVTFANATLSVVLTSTRPAPPSP